MKNYMTFITENVFSKLSNNIKKLISDVNDNSLKKTLTNITKSTDLNSTKKVMSNYFTERMNNKDIKDYNELENILKNDISSIYIILKLVAKKHGELFLPKKLYKESKNKFLKEIFSHDDFHKYLDNIVKKLIIKLAKDVNVKLEDVNEAQNLNFEKVKKIVNNYRLNLFKSLLNKFDEIIKQREKL